MQQQQNDPFLLLMYKAIELYLQGKLYRTRTYVNLAENRLDKIIEEVTKKSKDRRGHYV